MDWLGTIQCPFFMESFQCCKGKLCPSLQPENLQPISYPQITSNYLNIPGFPPSLLEGIRVDYISQSSHIPRDVYIILFFPTRNFSPKTGTPDLLWITSSTLWLEQFLPVLNLSLILSSFISRRKILHEKDPRHGKQFNCRVASPLFKFWSSFVQIFGQTSIAYNLGWHCRGAIFCPWVQNSTNSALIWNKNQALDQN